MPNIKVSKTTHKKAKNLQLQYRDMGVFKKLEDCLVEVKAREKVSDNLIFSGLFNVGVPERVEKKSKKNDWGFGL